MCIRLINRNHLWFALRSPEFPGACIASGREVLALHLPVNRECQRFVYHTQGPMSPRAATGGGSSGGTGSDLSCCLRIHHSMTSNGTLLCKKQ